MFDVVARAASSTAVEIFVLYALAVACACRRLILSGGKPRRTRLRSNLGGSSTPFRIVSVAAEIEADWMAQFVARPIVLL